MPAARVALVLLHPVVGVALVDTGTHPTEDGIARLRRKLTAAGFNARFRGRLPVVQCMVPASQIEVLGDILEWAFADEPPIALSGEGSWVLAARDALAAAPGRLLPRRGPALDRTGLAGLLRFWAALLIVGSAAATVLQTLGPPRHHRTDPVPEPVASLATASPPTVSRSAAVQPDVSPATGGGSATAEPVATAVEPGCARKPAPVTTATSTLDTAAPNADDARVAPEPTVPTPPPVDRPTAATPAPARDVLALAELTPTAIERGSNQTSEATSNAPSVPAQIAAAPVADNAPGPAAAPAAPVEAAKPETAEPPTVTVAILPPNQPATVQPSLLDPPPAAQGPVRSPPVPPAPSAPNKVHATRSGPVRPSHDPPVFAVGGPQRPVEQKCRNILGRAQLGEELSDADRAILRAGCKERR
jgi:hypothetical protein